VCKYNFIKEYKTQCEVSESHTYSKKNNTLTGNCDIDVDECASKPCKNGATCFDSTDNSSISFDAYQCTCKAGFANGVCKYKFIEEYTTECSVTDSRASQSLSGNCDISVNECASNPCENGGVCRESSSDVSISIHAYQCSCPRGFTNGVCAYKYLPEYETSCNVMESDDGLATNCEMPAKWCEPIFLGEDIGWAEVFAWSDKDQDCALDMTELTHVCSEFYEECLGYLYGLIPEPHLVDKCAPVYMGEEVGFMDVYAFFDANGDCKMQESEIAALCAEFEEMCLSFIGVKHEKDACEPIYLGEDAGWIDLFKYFDDGDCILEAAELSKMCGEMPEACRAFIKSSKTQCEPVFLSSNVGWANVFQNFTSKKCVLDMHVLEHMCAGAKSECRAFGNFSACHPVYLGDGIGFLDVFSTSASNTTNGTGCAIDMYKLSTACVNYPSQCAAFLRSGHCPPVWLSRSLNYRDVYDYSSSDKSCKLSTKKLQATCGKGKGTDDCRKLLSTNGCPAGWRDHDKNISTGCIACQPGQFSPARATQCADCKKGWADTDKNPATPCQRCANGTTSAAGATTCTKLMDFCRAVNLGPNVGEQRIFKWDANQRSCIVQPGLLYKACGDKYYDECLAWLGNMNRKCDPVYLGDDIGWVSVFSYDSSTESCLLNHGELATVCSDDMPECVKFLRSNDKRECNPSYLGPKVGWAGVSSKVNGECKVDNDKIKKLCGDSISVCQKYAKGEGAKAKGHECEPLYLGDKVGFASVFVKKGKECQLDSKALKKVCERGNEKQCAALLIKSTQG